MITVKQKQQTYTIYANCQTSLIQAHLNLSEEFKEKYTYEELPRNYVAIQNELEIPEDIISRTKLFIYQPISSQYLSRSSYYIKKQLPSDCICISFPYVYFEGYWPENAKNPVNKKSNKYPFGKFPYGDSNIIDMIAKGKIPAEIIEQLEKEDFYQSDYLRQNLQQTLLELIKRESETDLKISNFIKENYRQIRLFHAPNHPANIIGLHLANQILSKLGLSTLSQTRAYENFSDYQLPIYPSVSKILGLKFFTKEDLYTVTFSNQKINFQDYIKAYMRQYSKDTEEIKENTMDEDIKEFHKHFNLLKQKALGKLGDQFFAVERKSLQQSRLFMVDLIPHIHRLFYNVPLGTTINVLDVGIHSGGGTALLAELHNKRSYNHLKMNVTGLDIVDDFKHYMKLCYPSFRFMKQDLFKIPDGNTWDLVICSHVIEHLPDPIPFIKQMKNLSSRYVIIACPYNEKQLRQGHVTTINQELISKLNPIEYHVYTNFCWRVRGECLIMIFDTRDKTN